VSVERVAILGCAGAGKTRAALLVAERTGLPVVHLDVLFWRAGWVAAEETEAQAALVAVADAPRWIIEGSFVRDGSDQRFARADTVIFLDVGRWRCLGRVLRRLVRDRGRRRADLPPAARRPSRRISCAGSGATRAWIAPPCSSSSRRSSSAASASTGSAPGRTSTPSSQRSQAAPGPPT
jgi:hypothetical protein